MCGLTLLSLLALPCQFFYIIALGQPQANLTERGAASKVLRSHKSWRPTTRCTEQRLKLKPRHTKRHQTTQKGEMRERDGKHNSQRLPGFFHLFFFPLSLAVTTREKSCSLHSRKSPFEYFSLFCCKIKGRDCHFAMTARHRSESREGKVNFMMPHQHIFQQGVTSTTKPVILPWF